MRVVYTPAHLGHEIVSETSMGVPIPANEVAERAEIIRATLERDGGYEIEGPVGHGDAPILAVHDKGLLRFLAEAWTQHRAQAIERPSLIPETIFQRGYVEGMGGDGFVPRETEAIGGRAGFYALDTSTPIVAGTYVAARASVDVALTAVDRVLAGDEAVYGLCRPPGHHAGRSTYGGYCFFNNASIAAQAITERTGERVSVLDVDFHHGNGTQQIFWRRSDVLYVSLHGDPVRQYPYFLGFAEEVGEGPGAGANLNLPLPAGTTNEQYLAALERGLARIADEPGSTVVVSLGLDTYGQDPICDFALTTDVYHEVGRRVAALGRKLVILQEGGYHRPALGENVRAWLRGVEGRPHDPLPAAGFTAAGTRG